MWLSYNLIHTVCLEFSKLGCHTTQPVAVELLRFALGRRLWECCVYSGESRTKLSDTVFLRYARVIVCHLPGSVLEVLFGQNISILRLECPAHVGTELRPNIIEPCFSKNKV